MQRSAGPSQGGDSHARADRTLRRRWREYADEKLAKKAKLRHAVNMLRHGQVARVFYHMRDMVGTRAEEEGKMNKAVKHWQNRALSHAWEGWGAYMHWRWQKKQAINMLRNNVLARAFRTWADGMDEEQRIRVSGGREVGRRGGGDAPH